VWRGAYDDPALLARVRLLGNHGGTGPHHHERVGPHVGRNSRLDAIQAAVLLGHAGAVPDRVARRRALAERYDRALPPGFRPLARSAGSPVHQYAVRVADRDAVRARLAERGIETAVYYPRPLQRQPALAGLARGDTPVADRLCAELLALPIHEGLTEEDADRVIAAAIGP